MPFRSSSGTFGSALRPESSTGVLHHVMVRGIERRAIIRTDADREDFVARLAALAEAGAVTVYAWALLPPQAHFVVRTGHPPPRAEPAVAPHGVRGGLQSPPPARRPPLPEPVQVNLAVSPPIGCLAGPHR